MEDNLGFVIWVCDRGMDEWRMLSTLYATEDAAMEAKLRKQGAYNSVQVRPATKADIDRINDW